MPLRLYNTLSREREIFTPLDANNVRLYVCGPTVYDFAHIGNARPLIVFDVLFRVLREKYGGKNVKYVRNITDVDDKINARAAERGVTIRELTEETNRIFQEDAAALGCLPPDVQPRATEHIAEMIAIIEKLIANGHAYAADGHVLFDVPSMPDYGQLSRRPLDDMIAGARVKSRPTRRARWISCCGSRRRKTSPAGTAPGVAAVRAGISNARPCPKNISAKSLTFTAAESTSSSRITRMKSPRPAALLVMK